jgi:hypothetical protein
MCYCMESNNMKMAILSKVCIQSSVNMSLIWQCALMLRCTMYVAASVHIVILSHVLYMHDMWLLLNWKNMPFREVYLNIKGEIVLFILKSIHLTCLLLTCQWWTGAMLMRHPGVWIQLEQCSWGTLGFGYSRSNAHEAPWHAWGLATAVLIREVLFS